MALFVSSYSRVRVTSERGKRDNPAEHPATNARSGIAHGMERVKLNYDPRFVKRSLTRIYTIHHYIDIIHKVKPMSNFIHIVINVLELAFQSHESVGTEDFYLSRTLGHGRCL